MRFKAQQIAQLLKGRVEGDPNIEVDNISKIEEGKPQTLSFLANPKYEPYIYTTQSSIILVNESFVAKMPVSATLIRVPDAYAAFAELLKLYASMANDKKGVSSLAFIASNAKIGKDVYIGEYAVISENATIGDNAKIYPQTYIGNGCTIGDNTTLYAGVKVYKDCQIGNNCIIHSGAVIGADGFGFAPQPDGHYEKIPQLGNVVIDDNVEIGANTTIDRAVMGSTHIHQGVKLDNLIMVAHNVEIGTNTAMAAQSGISGSTHLGNNCVIAGQVGFGGHLHIADGTKIGAQSGVIQDIKQPNQSVMGSPHEPLQQHMRNIIHLKHIGILADRIEQLEKELAKLKSENK